MKRQHYRPEIVRSRDGQVSSYVSGHFAESVTNLFRPTDEEIRKMLTVIRDRLSISVPHLAALLGVPLITVRRWMDRSRKPCSAAKRLIWLLHTNLVSPETMERPGAWFAWGRTPKNPPSHKADGETLYEAVPREL